MSIRTSVVSTTKLSMNSFVRIASVRAPVNKLVEGDSNV